jgi:hypothetical protein
VFSSLSFLHISYSSFPTFVCHRCLLLGWGTLASWLGPPKPLDSIFTSQSCNLLTKQRSWTTAVKTSLSPAWWNTSVISALRRLRQGGLRVSGQPELYSETLSQKKKMQKATQKFLWANTRDFTKGGKNKQAKKITKKKELEFTDTFFSPILMT